MTSIEQRAPSWITFLTAEQWGRQLIHPMHPEHLNDPETYVHHTAGNPYRAWTGAQAMQELQRQAHNKGMATVSYDVVVHRAATGRVTIMEGRGAARSAATKDRNEEGEAICMMGYFHPGHALSAQPTDSEIEGIAWGIAWMMERGWSARDTKILGHRDNPRHPNATSCPGNFLYARLKDIRNNVRLITSTPAPLPPPPPPPPPITYPTGADMIHPVAKFRNSDTRHFGAPLNANRDYEFGLDPARIPANAVAVALNVAVVPAGTAGWLDIRPAGSPPAGTSTVNYEATGAHNGATVIGVKDLKFTVHTSAPAHVIVDVTGYWTP
jgi:hypothetical protein